MDPTILAALLTIGFTIFSGLIALAYRNLRNRIEALEEDTDDNGNDYQSVRERVNTIWNFLFGVEDDGTDGGLAADIQDGFDNIEEELEQTQAKQEEYHTKEMDALETLVNEIHDEESLDINREDVFGDQ